MPKRDFEIPQEEEYRQKFEEESARLAADNDVLLKQLAEMAATMESVVQVDEYPGCHISGST